MKKLKWAILIVVITSFIACSKEEPVSNLQMKIDSVQSKIDTLKEELARLKEMDTTTEKKKLTVVNTQKVGKRHFTAFFEIFGSVQTDNNVVVTSETSGLIKSIKAKQGQNIRKGQAIAYLDTDIIGANIQEVKSSLDFAKDMLKKQENLREKNVGTEVAYLEAKNRVDNLEKKLSTLQTQLGKSVVRAPISGFIDEIFPKEGEMASPGMPLARIVNIEEVYIEGDVSEKYLPKVKEGDTILVSIPTLDSTIEKAITYKGRFVNPNNRTFKIRTEFKNTDQYLLPNILASLKIRSYDKDNTIVVPSKVVMDDGKQFYVYTVKDGIVYKKTITTGPSYEGETVVNSGLNPGDILITSGNTSVVDGEEIEIKN